jgi:protein subunit release factor A
MLEEKLKALDRQYAELEARLAAPETYDDPARVARLNKEQRDLEPVVTAYRTYVRRQKDLADAQALMSDPDMKELAQEEYQAAKADLERLVEEIRILLLPRDPTTPRTSLWRSGPGWAARRPPSLPTPSIACTACTPNPAAGRWRWTASVRPSWAA